MNARLLRNILASPLAPARAVLAALKQPLDHLADPTGQGKAFKDLVKDPQFYGLTALGTGIDYGLYKGYKYLTESPEERRLNSLGEVMTPVSTMLGLNDLDKKKSGVAAAAFLAAPVLGAILAGSKGFGQGAGISAGSLAGYHAGKHIGDLFANGDIIEGMNSDQKRLARMAAIAGVTALGGLGGLHMSNTLRASNN